MATSLDSLFKPMGTSGTTSTYQSYAPEYSPENIASLTSQYASLLEPYKKKSLASMLNKLGGYGVASGSPLSYGLGDVETQYLGSLADYSRGLSEKGLSASQQERQFQQEQQRLKDAIEAQKEWELAKGGGDVLGKLLSGWLGSGGGGGVGGGFTWPSLGGGTQPSTGGGGGFQSPRLDLTDFMKNIQDPSRWTRPSDMLSNLWRTIEDIGKGGGQTIGGIGDWLGKTWDWATGFNPPTGGTGSVPSVGSKVSTAWPNLGGIALGSGLLSGGLETLRTGNIGKGVQAGIPSGILASAYAANPLLGLAMQNMPTIGKNLDEGLRSFLNQRTTDPNAAAHANEANRWSNIQNELQIPLTGSNPSEIFDNFKGLMQSIPENQRATTFQQMIDSSPSFKRLVQDNGGFWFGSIEGKENSARPFTNFLKDIGAVDNYGAYYIGNDTWGNINQPGTGFAKLEYAQNYEKYGAKKPQQISSEEQARNARIEEASRKSEKEAATKLIQEKLAQGEPIPDYLAKLMGLGGGSAWFTQMPFLTT